MDVQQLIYMKLFYLAGRGGRKLDDVRDKYQKACRKLHLAHNEYVLLISEAIEVEKDFRTILLPGLLEHQQSIQENFIADWYGMLNYFVYLSFLLNYFHLTVECACGPT